MSTYNGFDGSQRTRALHWLKREYAAGRRQRPVICDVCGQTEGLIEAHSENYSSPFGDHIGQHGLCFRCHMAIHCRFRNPAAWTTYKQQIREGRIFYPIHTRNFGLFLAEFSRHGSNVEAAQGTPKERTLLDGLTMERPTAKD